MLAPLAGFQVTINGRFWVTTEGNLIRLSSGRILLSYGNRNWGNYGVDARFSEDEGKSWGSPFRLAHCPYSDCGYPSSVELPDGSLLTAYYTKVSDGFHYEMRVAALSLRGFTADAI